MLDDHLQQHEMFLDKTYPSGAEEWYCPTCGRHFVMQWPPKYKRIVLNGGDEYAAHSAVKGNLQIGAATLQNREHTETPEEGLRLDHWETWLNSNDAAHWWPED